MSGWIALDRGTLRDWPLPEITDDADKDDRGRVVVAGGSREIAGAVQLAGVSALRAGAGKLVIATAASVATQLVHAVPEARVVGVAESPSGALLEADPELFSNAAAVLVGPGMMDEAGSLGFVRAVLAACRERPVVVDAAAMDVVRTLGRFEQPVLLTPHAGEMAHLIGRPKDEVLAEPERFAREAARQWNAVVALKGATTSIATPDGRGWRHEGGHPGLGTSGSGDVLAGLIAGYAARGAPLEQACAWGVVMHALAGRELARRLGPIGLLARELPGEVPRLMRRVAG